MKAKQNLIFIALMAIVWSCTTTRHNKYFPEYEGKELIKQMAYCKCLAYCFPNDSNVIQDYSIPWLNIIAGEFYVPFLTRRIRPVLDSLAKSEYESLEASKYPDEPVAEGRYGHAAYSLGCLKFYQSKTLDSVTTALLKEFKKKYKANNMFEVMDRGLKQRSKKKR